MNMNCVTAEVHVPLKLAIQLNYGRFGKVPVEIDLEKLSPEEKDLLLSWGGWKEGPLGAVLRGTKMEWPDAEAARRGCIIMYKYIVAETAPPSLADVLRALQARRDREPLNMQYEKIAQERRDAAENAQSKKRSWVRRLFGGAE